MEDNILTNKNMELGKIIAENRRKINWTQEKLAEYLGVTKASVSKWETGRSHPDILFLPELATLFNITIDELLDYKTNLTDKQIVILYDNLNRIINDKGFEEAYKQMIFYLRRYGSNTKFLLSIIQWIVNGIYHCAEENKEFYYSFAIDLADKVMDISNDPVKIEEAKVLKGMIYSVTGDYEKIIEMSKTVMSPVHFTLDQMYVGSLLVSGRTEEYKEGFQVLLYQYLMSLLSLISNQIVYFSEDEKWFDRLFKTGEDIIESFRLYELPRNEVIAFYTCAAIGYSINENIDKALEQLENYVSLIEKINLPLVLKGSDLFDSLDGWIRENILLQGNTPMINEDINEQLLNIIYSHPALEKLKEEKRFKNIERRLIKKLK